MERMKDDSEDNKYKVSMKRGALSCGIDIVFFALAPCIAILLIISNYPDLNRTEMDTMMYWSIVLGLSIAVFSFFEAYYYPGHKRRLISGIFGTIMIMVWTYMVFGGTTIKSDYGGYVFFIDINRLILILMMGISLKAIYRLAEYFTHRTKGEGIVTPTSNNVVQ